MDESDQRLCQERSNSAQSYCNPKLQAKGRPITMLTKLKARNFKCF